MNNIFENFYLIHHNQSCIYNLLNFILINQFVLAFSLDYYYFFIVLVDIIFFTKNHFIHIITN